MSNWQAKTLGDVCEVIAGQSPEGSSYNDRGEGIEFHQGKKLFGKNNLKISATYTAQPTKRAEPGDILMSVRAPVGPINYTDRKICIGRGLAAIRASDKTDRSYLFHFLRMNEANINGTEGATFASINKKDIESIILPLPSLEEQRRIVARLDAAFEKIDRAIELTVRNKQNSNNLFLQNSKKILVKAEGVDKKVYDILRLEYGKSLARVDRKPDGNFAAYGANGVKDRTDKYYWDIPSIIVGRKGSAGELTRVDEPFWPLDVTYYVTHDVNKTNIDYIFSILESLNLPSYARGVKPGINRNDIYALDVVLPEISDQVILANKIEEMRKQTDELSKLYASKLKELKNLKQSLLSAAFSESDVK